MKNLRLTAFGLTAVLTVIMMAATMVENVFGTSAAHNMLYTSPITIAIWSAATVAGTAYLLCRLKSKHIATTAIHMSFVIIQVGAVTTHIYGKSGTVNLVKGGRAVKAFKGYGNTPVALPFHIRLTDCMTKYYPGTNAGMDYISHIEIATDDGKTIKGTVSMNNVFKYNGYRMYQTAIGNNSSLISISYDPWGIGITYAGYVLLLASIVMFLVRRRNMFVGLLNNPTLKRGLAACFILSAVVLPAAADNSCRQPRVLQRGLAKNFGKLYIYYNERVCPLNTMATEFCTKLYGKSEYNGFTAEQVLTGWIFFYEDWKNEPMIKIKGKDIKNLLGTEDDYVCLNDFYSINGYKLEEIRKELNNKNAIDADEKCNLISLVCTGRAIRIYPYKQSTTKENTMEWLSWVDILPGDMEEKDIKFITGSMEYIAMQIEHGRNIEANEALMKIKEYQKEKAGGDDLLPSDSKFEAEIIYNRYARTLFPAIFCIIAGALFFLILCHKISSSRRIPKAMNVLQTAILTITLIYLSAIIMLRWFVSGHIPMSNGFETMLLMAWSIAILALSLRNSIEIVAPAGILTCGFALLVASIGESSPQITNLMPVLASPLLSIHVMIIMLAYALLAIMTINSIAAIITGKAHVKARFMIICRILLYPAVFFLAIGIFVGAVWANISWGTYWSWDPKETWALVTMIIYSYPLHTKSLPFFQRPTVFHLYIIFAFFSVLMTYFGVNFVLGGMHSYA